MEDRKKKNITTVSHPLIALENVSQIELNANWDKPWRLCLIDLDPIESTALYERHRSARSVTNTLRNERLLSKRNLESIRITMVLENLLWNSEF